LPRQFWRIRLVARLKFIAFPWQPPIKFARGSFLRQKAASGSFGATQSAFCVLPAVAKVRRDELCYSLTGENIHYGTPANIEAPPEFPVAHRMVLRRTKIVATNDCRSRSASTSRSEILMIELAV
jgi:hypothetical protein